VSNFLNSIPLSIKGKLIIVYDFDERVGVAAAAADLLVERNFTNVYVLSKVRIIISHSILFFHLGFMHVIYV
jgi:hypothetical protein